MRCCAEPIRQFFSFDCLLVKAAFDAVIPITTGKPKDLSGFSSSSGNGVVDVSKKCVNSHCSVYKLSCYNFNIILLRAIKNYFTVNKMHMNL